MRHDTFDALLSDCGDALDRTTRKTMEAGLGADFADVIIHTSPLAASANRALASKAFTVGNHIFFADGAYRPQSRFGRLLIAHELAHVVQKRLRGAAAAAANEGAAELEADAAAIRVTQGGRYRCEVALPPHTASCWGEAGHYYTANFVLQAAGVDPAKAGQIAFFAQMGDEVIELDATEQGYAWAENEAAAQTVQGGSVLGGPLTGLAGSALKQWYFDQRMRVCKEIGMGLHCLTGAAASRETGWRASVLENLPPDTGDLSLGLAVHAFGDSFAHRDLRDTKVMYKPIIGHAIEVVRNKQGHTWEQAIEIAHIPDHIDQRKALYLEYGRELYAIARYRWQTPASKGISLGALTDALDEISNVVGEENQIFKIRQLAAKLCHAIDRKYFPELKIPDGDDYKDCVPFNRFMAIHKLPPNFLKLARDRAHAWSYLSASAPPPRKSKLADYSFSPPPTPAPTTNGARTHTVAPGDSLWAIAKHYYGTSERWPSIWNENKKLIGANPNVILPGTKLVIP
jgi:hypothetical protein